MTVVRLPKGGVVVRPRAVVVGLSALLLGVLATASSTGTGDVPMTPADVLAVLGGGGERIHRFAVLEVWLPRALVGALVGLALGIAGAVTQGIARNPLAGPDILGVSAGASVAVVGVIVGTGSGHGGLSGSLASVGVPALSLLGGFAGAAAVYLLAWRRGLDGYRLVLVGIGVTAVLANIKLWLLTVGDVNDTGRALVWVTGSLNGRDWEHVVPVLWALAVCVPLVLLGSRTLGALQLGDDTVRGLGIRMNGARTLLVLGAVVLASIATAAAGPIAFVALVSPQIALRLCRTATPPPLVSALIGAVLTIVADLIARTIVPSAQLPVGIVTAALGAPYLIYLLIRSRREARS